MNKLQSRLCALSDDQLRSMVLRVAAQDPYFCDVFAMELGDTLDAFAGNVFPLTHNKPIRKRPITRPRTLSNTLVHFPPTLQAASPESDREDHAYHPGQLESEEYEFLTVTQEGRAYRRVQTVSMWSCCEGDDTSAGCKISPADTILSDHSESRYRRTRTKSRKRLCTRA